MTATPVTIKWKYEKTRFSKDLFSIAVGSSDNRITTVLGEGPVNGWRRNVTYVLIGNWEENPSFGKQFRFSGVYEDAPKCEASICSYLQGLPGIGPVRAKQLYLEYGTSAMEVVRERTEEVRQMLGLKPGKLDEAKRRLEEKRTHEDLQLAMIEVLTQASLPGSYSARVIETLGPSAPSLIRTDPFCLLRVPGIGFKMADAAFLALGGAPDDVARVEQFLIYWMDTDRTGHTWHCLPEAKAAIAEQFTHDVDVDYLVNDMSATHGIGLKFAGKTYFTSQRKLNHERAIANWLAQPRTGVWEIEPPTNPNYSESQVEAMQSILSHPLSILAGAPGTGKSYLTCDIIRALEEVGESPLVCCPTGVAAVRLNDTLSAMGLRTRASTIHRALEPEFGAGGFTFRRNAQSQLVDKYVIVDEFGMVSAPLATLLLPAIPTDTRVLFVGDPYQLPPVGHGAVMRDALRIIPSVELRECHRNAGSMVQACHNIRDGRPVQFDDKLVIPQPDEDVAPQNLRIIETTSVVSETVSLVQKLLKNRPQAGGKQIEPDDIQVVVATNRTRLELNRKLQDAFNPHGMGINRDFREGDRVMQLSNTWMNVAMDTLADGEVPKDNAVHTEDGWQYQIANGDVGTIIGEGKRGQLIVRFRNPTRTTVTPQKDLTLAYACTCHKLQGATVGIAIVAIESAQATPYGIVDAGWLTTALSRAQHACFVIGKARTVRECQKRRSSHARMTFLVEETEKVTRTWSRTDDTRKAGRHEDQAAAR